MSKETKHLRFKLTPKEYADFWYVVSLLDESKKKPAFLKMLTILRKKLE